MARAERGEDVHALVLEHADGLRDEDLARFWSEFLPEVAPHHGRDFCGLRARVMQVRAHYGMQQLHAFERIAARYAVLLYARMEPLFLSSGLAPIFTGRKAAIDVPTQHHVRLLACHIVRQGKASVDEVMRDPALANAHLASFTLFSGHALRALFRYEELVFQAQRLRAMEAFTRHEGRKPLTDREQRAATFIEGIVRRSVGAFDLIEFLKAQFAGEEDRLDVPEQWPRFTLTDENEVVKLPS
jgi:hypothetical protein